MEVLLYRVDEPDPPSLVVDLTSWCREGPELGWSYLPGHRRPDVVRQGALCCLTRLSELLAFLSRGPGTSSLLPSEVSIENERFRSERGRRVVTELHSQPGERKEAHGGEQSAQDRKNSVAQDRENARACSASGGLARRRCC